MPLPWRLGGVLDTTPPSFFHCLGRSSFQSPGRPTRISSAESLVTTGVGTLGGTDLPLRLPCASALTCIHSGLVESTPSVRSKDRLSMKSLPQMRPAQAPK